MLKALIVDEDNLDRCKEILDRQNIPQRCVEEPHWLIWETEDDSYIGLLPHMVARDKFTVVGHTEDSMIVERI